MNTVVATSYNTSLVVLSYVISAIGSFIALSIAGRLRYGSKRSNGFTIASAGIALGGIGVWSMHFIAMLALRLNVGISYSMVETGISLLAAILISSLAFTIVARDPKSLNRLLGAGTMLGLGAVVMHYLGMHGMRFGGFFQWDYTIVAASVAIAFVAATAALWLAFNTTRIVTRVAAACVMGIAVSAMHYTGMSAADFVCTTDNPLAIPSGFGVVSSLDLPMLVITLAVGMALALGADLFFHDKTGRGTRQRAQSSLHDAHTQF